MFLNTSKMPWVSLREDGDDTFLTTFTYASWPTTGVLNGLHKHPTLKDANGYLIMFFGTDAANEDFLYKLWGRNRTNGPMLLLLAGEVTLGTQVATTHPITQATLTSGLFGDTITVTGGLFENLVDILDSGNNRICALKLDGVSVDDLFMEIDLDGGDGTAAASAYAAITGY